MGSITSLRIICLSLSLVICACSSMQPQESNETDELGGGPLGKSRSNKELRDILITADSAYKSGDLELARQNYLLALEDDAANQQALYRLGNMAFKNKHFEEAIDYYRKTLKSNPNHSRAHHNLSVALLVDARIHLTAYLALMDPAKSNSHILKMVDEIDQFAKGQKQWSSKEKGDKKGAEVTSGVREYESNYME